MHAISQAVLSSVMERQWYRCIYHVGHLVLYVTLYWNANMACLLWQRLAELSRLLLWCLSLPGLRQNVLNRSQTTFFFYLNSMLNFWAHLCNLHDGLIFITFCLYSVQTWPIIRHWANCDRLHSQKNSRQQMVMVFLLWQVGLIANVKLHFFQ